MQVECPRKLRSGVYVQQAFDRRLPDAQWEKACVGSKCTVKIQTVTSRPDELFQISGLNHLYLSIKYLSTRSLIRLIQAQMSG